MSENNKFLVITDEHNKDTAAHPNGFNHNINMNGNKITNLVTPEDDTDTATKGYVDNHLQYLDVFNMFIVVNKEDSTKVHGLNKTYDSHAITSNELAVGWSSPDLITDTFYSYDSDTGTFDASAYEYSLNNKVIFSITTSTYRTTHLNNTDDSTGTIPAFIMKFYHPTMVYYGDNTHPIRIFRENARTNALSPLLRAGFSNPEIDNESDWSFLPFPVKTGDVLFVKSDTQILMVCPFVTPQSTIL